MQRAVGHPPTVSVGAATAALGHDLLGQEGPQLLAGVLESLPMAVAVRVVGPGCPVAAANDRFRLWLDSLTTAGGPDGASLTDEVTSLVTTAVRTGRPQHLQGLRLAAAGEAEGEPPDAAAWDVSVHPLRDTHGRVAHVVQAVRDAAARPGTDEGSPDGEDVSSLRLRLDRMMALDKLKSDFMNLTTHELRSPLAIVYGYLSMMESGMLGELSGELREAVGSSIQSVELMMQLVTELVDMARLDETRLDPTREPVDLAGVVTEVAVRVESSERHHLRLDVGAGPAPVLGDRGQLLRVFANLVDNAIKYSPDGGEIGIRMRRLGRQVAVDIIDQGVGIAPADMDRLFTRFGRIVTSATEGIGGTGLGLYLCRELVRRLGGDVTATSTEGHGSTFTVRLPAVPGTARTRLAS
ncbi:MAG: ATP-binding protein [Candidatus Dormibacteria bacterium]|jgi:signal transduction histidine kinase